MTGNIAGKRNKAVFLAFVLALVAMTATAGWAASWQEDLAYEYAGGNGTEGDPFQIATPQQLAWMANQIQNGNDNGTGENRSHFILTEGLSLTGRVWFPIGGSLVSGIERRVFNGYFDGNGKTISGLTIETADGDYQGLFGYIGGEGVVTNLTLEGGRVDGRENVGSIAGVNSGEVSYCKSNVEIIGAGYNIGGLIGYNNGTVSDSEASGNVTGSSDNVGGLVGVNAEDNGARGKISASKAFGNVTGSGSGGYTGKIGGLVGSNEGDLENCGAFFTLVTGYAYVGGLVGHNSRDYYSSINGSIISGQAEGTVKSADDYAGGLVGYNYRGDISNSTASVTVTGGRYYVGGLVGSNSSSGSVSNSSASGNVSSNRNDVGGLAGQSNGSLLDCFSTVTVTGGSNVGGLVGYASGTVVRCEAYGNVAGSGNNVGGLAGELYTSISENLAYGNVTGANNVGGLVGYYSGYNNLVSNSLAYGNVTGVENVGGLIGNNDAGNVTSSLASGNVHGTGNNVGGLIGYIDYYWNPQINNSLSLGAVRGDSSNVGALIGFNGGTVSVCMAAGSVRGGGGNVGGLVGNNTGTVRNNLSVARVSSTSTAGVGGLIGNHSGSGTNNAFDFQASGQTRGEGLGSLTSTQYPTNVITNGTNFPFEPNAPWSLTAGYYPRPTALMNPGTQLDAEIAEKIKILTALAATPIFLATNETPQNVTTPFLVPVKDADDMDVVWTSATGVCEIADAPDNRYKQVTVLRTGFDVLTLKRAGAENPERKNFALGIYEAEDAPYTVSFSRNDGGTGTIPSITGVWYAEKIKAPSEPTRPNYNFLGWFKETTGLNEWNFNTDVVMADMTLYAKWELNTPVTYTVTFDSNGGSAVPPQANIPSSGKVMRPAPDPVKTGYTFGGWYKEAACTNVWNFDDAVTANMTLFAKWTSNGGGGAGDGGGGGGAGSGGAGGGGGSDSGGGGGCNTAGFGALALVIPFIIKKKK